MTNPTRAISLVLAAAVVAVILAPLVHLFLRVFAAPTVIQETISQRVTWELLGRSVLLAAIVGIGSMSLGTFFAWLTVRAAWGATMRLALTVLLCSTLIMPSYVLAFGLIASTGADGAFAWLIPAGYGVRDTPLLSSSIVLICCTYPYVLLSVRGTMLRECGSLEEAALSVGASRWRAFFSVTLPRIAPGMTWGGVLAALYALSDFGAVSLLRYDTLTWGIYSRYYYGSIAERDQARVLCFMLAIVTIGIIATMRFVRPTITMSTSATTIAQSYVRLRWWIIPAIILITLPLTIGLFAPLSAILFWFSSSETPMQLIRDCGPATTATMQYAVVAAFLVPILALPVASMHLGRGRRAGTYLTPLTLVGFALPGIVIAIAAAGLALSTDEFIERLFNWPLENRLYQSHMIILLAYATLFLPEAVGPMTASAARVHPEQLDAAAQYGRGAFGNWLRIALPQMMPGIAAGAAIVFVTTAKELPATLILSPLNVRTLATTLWSAMEDAMFAQAAAASLLLLIVGAIGMAAFLLLERIGRSG